MLHVSKTALLAEMRCWEQEDEEQEAAAVAGMVSSMLTGWGWCMIDLVPCSAVVTVHPLYAVSWPSLHLDQANHAYCPAVVQPCCCRVLLNFVSTARKLL